MTNKDLLKALERAINYCELQLGYSTDLLTTENYLGRIKAYRNVIKTLYPDYDDGGAGTSLN